MLEDEGEVGVAFSGFLEKKGNMRWQSRYFEVRIDVSAGCTTRRRF